MSGAKEALRWRVDGEGKIAVPPAGDAETLRPFVEFILPRPLHLKVHRQDLTREQMRAALLEECEKHEWARARRKQVHDAAECMEECAPGGFVRVDKSAIDALSDKPGARPEERSFYSFSCDISTRSRKQSARPRGQHATKSMKALRSCYLFWPRNLLHEERGILER